MKRRSRIEDRRSKIEDCRARDSSILDPRSSILDPRSSILDHLRVLRFFVVLASLLLFELNATRAQSLSSVAADIREEALRANSSDVGRPLPLAGHWNLGQEKNGFSPGYQMKMIERGHHLLPWFLLPDASRQSGRSALDQLLRGSHQKRSRAETTDSFGRHAMGDDAFG